MVHIVLLSLISAAMALAPQTPDTSLATLLNQLRETGLHGGGWRDTLVWQPQDAGTAQLLRSTGVRAHDVILPVGTAPLTCPGSTDATGAQFAQTVRARVRLHGVDSATVELVVGCDFTYRGTVRTFSEGKLWEARKGPDGWDVALRRQWIT
jgi:hypothetical protein